MVNYHIIYDNIIYNYQYFSSLKQFIQYKLNKLMVGILSCTLDFLNLILTLSQHIYIYYSCLLLLFL